MAITSTISKLKTKRIATQADTLGGLTVRNFSFTLPAGAANDAVATTVGLPAGAVCVGGWMKANAAVVTAGAAYSFKSTTANITFASVANSATANSTSYVPLTISTSTPVGAPANDDTISFAIATANQANAVTYTVSLLFAGVGQDDAPYSTFSI